MRVFSVALFAVLLTTPMTTSAQSQFEVGQVYKDILHLQKNGTKMQVPLPPGEWEVAAVDIRKFRGTGTEFLSAFLFNYSKDTLIAGMSIRFPSMNLRRNWPTTTWCRSEWNNYAEEIAMYNRTQTDCWGVASNTTIPDHAPTGIVKSMAYLKEKGVPIPAHIVYARFDRINYDELLLLEYVFNPEAFGVAPSGEGNHKTSDYSVAKIDDFPVKKAFINRVIEWGKMAKRYTDLGFEGKLTENKMEKFDFK